MQIFVIVFLIAITSTLTGCDPEQEKAAANQAKAQQESQKKLWTFEKLPPPKPRPQSKENF